MKNKITVANTVYKLWLGQSSLGKSCGFSKASSYQERSVPKHATAHIHKRWQTYKTENQIEQNTWNKNIDCITNFVFDISFPFK
ncbi:MAG: hypothetical protein CL530_12165 [Aequorivita sp.]|nr:hypothetical protein [Aequorivita sp.]